MSRSLASLGPVVALSDADGATVQTCDDTVYGRPSAADVNHPNPYLFTGRRFDVETGLYYYRARMYDPYTGRFLQTDPIGYRDGVNGYRYCGNNPTNAVDPSGELKRPHGLHRLVTRPDPAMGALPGWSKARGDWLVLLAPLPLQRMLVPEAVLAEPMSTGPVDQECDNDGSFDCCGNV